MHVAFFHERFLFRFGHDRTMMLHGRELARLGHRVTFVAYRGDEEAIRRFGAALVLLPLGAPNYAALDEFGAQHLRENWSRLFRGGGPDVVVNGGWPFYSSARVFDELGVPSIYYDAGATPLEGVAPEDLAIQRKLRVLRRRHIRDNRASVSVSKFIARSQTLVDAPHTPNTVVYNAADHIEDPLWGVEEAGADADRLRALVSRARGGGRKLVLHLGRWESGYKNKAGAIEVLRGLLSKGHDLAMLVLAEAEAVIPSDLRGRLVFVGNPDDDGLRALMQTCDVGLSTSLWEGFNLPLAEMHFLGRPAYVLDVGAHPEVAITAEFVCPSPEEMVQRISKRLETEGGSQLPAAQVERYRERKKWRRAAQDLETILLRLAPPAAARARPEARLVLVDVTNSSRDPANSGVIRVTRRVTRELTEQISVLPVVWDEDLDDYRLAFQHEHECLSRFGGPRPQVARSGPEKIRLEDYLSQSSLRLADTVLFYPETILHPRLHRIAIWVARRDIDYVAVLHDVIPLTHPHYCDAGIVSIFREYVEFLKRSRLLIPNSGFTAEQWRGVVGDGEGPALAVELLPGDFGPRTAREPAGDAVVRLLTVSTLEPRKNHATLLDAFEAVQRAAPHLRLELHLVGNGYEGTDSVLTSVRARAKNNPSINYLGVIDDAALAELYARVDFTVYPSLIEGFGLPVLESVWRRRPFICHEQGSMAEIAAIGGGLTCDMTSVASLSEAILDMAGNRELRRTLRLAASVRKVRTWREYAGACLRHLLDGRGGRSAASPAQTSVVHGPRPVLRTANAADWDSLLYPEKPVTAWQMSDAERMSMAGLLARWRPSTYLEIGVFHGGSTLLASEFADKVVSIDIDPEAINRFDKPDNVTFIVGNSHEVVPGLLDDLESEGRYPEVVLIDGDHSTDGVKRDIELFLARRPPRPMLIMFHDSFNPDARAGICAADWRGCLWAHRLELDFVAGGVVDQPGNPFNGQMWGGLAVGLLLPTDRLGEFHLSASAQPAHDRASAQARAAA